MLFKKNKLETTSLALLFLAGLVGCSSIAQQPHTEMDPPVVIDSSAVSTPGPLRPSSAITEGMLFLDSGNGDGLVVNDEITILTNEAGPDANGNELAPAAMTDIWVRIRNGFGLPDYDHPGVGPDLNWYQNNPEYLKRTFDRARPYLHYIVEEVESRNMPLEIALLPVVESAFQPFAYSHGRAAGIWQFIPGTGSLYGLKQNWWYDGRRDVYAATRAALDYLQNLNRMFDGDWLLALAAYNCGEGTVSRAVKKNLAKDRPTDFWSLDLPNETRGYVPKLLALSNVVLAPEKHQIILVDIPNEPYFAVIETGSQIDLALAAELAGITTEDVYQLNPGFNRWATDPDGPHYLLIPLENAVQFSDSLETLPESKRIRWIRHKVRSGETLSAIAKKHNSSASLIANVNQIKKANIVAGEYLLIPVASKNLGDYSLTADQRRSEIQNKSRSGHKSIHVVKNGDTLWDIARKYKVGVQHLAKWNAMAPGDVLKSGQKIVVWSQAGNDTSRSTAAPMKEITQRVRYTVRQGDSLARIAQRFKVSINDLIRWNGLKGAKYLQPGQALTLFVDVTKQSGSL